MRLLHRVLRSVVGCGLVVASCGGEGEGEGSDDDYIIGDIIAISASMPLEGGEMTIQSVTLFDLGDSPDAVIPPGAEELAAELFANGDLAQDATAAARRVAEGPDDESIDDDEYILASVKVDEPERYEEAERTSNGKLTGWVDLHAAEKGAD